MNLKRRMNRFLVLGVGVLAAGLAAAPANAALISVIGGTPGVALPAAPSTTVSFVGGLATFPVEFFLATVNGLTVDVSSYGADPGPVSITDTGTGLPELIITNGMGSAVWAISNPAVLDAGAAHAITATLTLTSNATGEDLGLIGGLWNFLISIQGPDMAFTPGAPGTVTVLRPSVASFTLEIVPEPGTFALLGLGCIGLIPLVRRRMRRA